MPLTESFTNTATIGVTEFYLAANSTTAGAGQSSDGMVQVLIDFSALLAGDIYQVRLYESAASAGTRRIVFQDNYAGPMDAPIVATPALILLHKWDFSVTKIAGTDRSITWSIRTAT